MSNPSRTKIRLALQKNHYHYTITLTAMMYAKIRLNSCLCIFKGQPSYPDRQLHLSVQYIYRISSGLSGPIDLYLGRKPNVVHVQYPGSVQINYVPFCTPVDKQQTCAHREITSTDINKRHLTTINSYWQRGYSYITTVLLDQNYFPRVTLNVKLVFSHQALTAMSRCTFITFTHAITKELCCTWQFNNTVMLRHSQFPGSWQI